MTLRATLGVLACLALAPAVGLGAAAGAPPPLDSFYLSVLEDGIRTFDEGDAEAAARTLRIACFGLLEDPTALAGCLARLGIAQATAGDRDGLLETFRRLAAVEQRFQAYAAADLPAAVRSRFEEWLLQLVPEHQLAAVPVFFELALADALGKIRRLPPGERRKELEARIAQGSPSPRFSLLLAELEVEEGRPAEALRLAAAVLAGAPDDPDALCVRGLAAARSGACAGAVADLDRCARSRREAGLAAALLSCQVSLAQWPAARELLEALPPDLRGERQIARLARKVGRTGAPAVAQAALAEPEPARLPTSEPVGEPAATAAVPDSPRPPAAAAATLGRARQLLNEAQQAVDLEEPLRLAVAVADAHPAWAEAQHLAAEIAYRTARWQQAATYFRRGGDPGDERPNLLFYMAVTFFETGDRAAAAAALRRCRHKLPPTPVVESYARRILDGGMASE